MSFMSCRSRLRPDCLLGTLKTTWPRVDEGIGGAQETRYLGFFADSADLQGLAAGEGPMIARTLSSSMSCLAKETASRASAAILTIVRSSGHLMPPAALSLLTNMVAVLASGAPKFAAPPVMAKIAPILMTPAGLASGAPGPAGPEPSDSRGIL